MTTARKRNNKLIRSAKGTILFIFLLSLFFIMLLFSNEISTYVLDGLRLSVKVILPSVFPFLLISDVLISSSRFGKVHFLKNLFERIFNVCGEALCAFLCGILCGFPIGAKMSLELYNNGIISKCECERLMSFANNASPAYVIFVVGIALRGSVRDGILLYLIMIFSSLATGYFIGVNKKKSHNTNFILWQNYSFTNSIKSSATVCINICAFITTFAIICGLIKKLIKKTVACALIMSFLEIGNASLYLSELCISHPFYSFVMTAFALSFSGVSVIAQSTSLIGAGNDISIKKHVIYKLLQGAIATLFSASLFPFLK